MGNDGASARIYLVAEAGPTASQRLGSALAAADVASVLIVPAGSTALDPAETKTLVELIQSKGAAALIADDARLARTLKSDGVHLTTSPDIAARYAEAREILGTRYIVGVDAGGSRHDAMTLGELGADYIAFSLPPDADDGDAALDDQLDLLDWWGEIFEVPCVALGAREAGEARLQAEAHADFVAVTAPAGSSPADCAERIRAIGAAIGTAAPAA